MLLWRRAVNWAEGSVIMLSAGLTPGVAAALVEGWTGDLVAGDLGYEAD